jgi:GAF domain-containing protein
MEPLPETREALAEFVSLEEPDVDELLLGLGRDAERLVPELVGLSLGLVSEGLTFTLVASGTGIAALDATQYLDGGPCVEVSEGRSDTLLARPDDPLDEERWELYSRMGAAAGVASSLSMPLYRRGRLIGGVNLYASSADAFSPHRDQLAQLLGASASEAVSNADLSFATRLEAAEAPDRLRQQLDIDTAVGLLAGLKGTGVDTAERRLIQAAARAGIDVAVVARVVVLVCTGPDGPGDQDWWAQSPMWPGSR